MTVVTSSWYILCSRWPRAQFGLVRKEVFQKSTFSSWVLTEVTICFGVFVLFWFPAVACRVCLVARLHHPTDHPSFYFDDEPTFSRCVTTLRKATMPWESCSKRKGDEREKEEEKCMPPSEESVSLRLYGASYGQVAVE